MNWTLRGSRNLSVGVEMTRSVLRMCALSGEAGEPCADELQWTIPDGTNLSTDELEFQQIDFVSKFVKSHDLQGVKAVLSVPNDKVVVRYMQLPNLPLKQMKQAVAVELGATIHLPFDNPVYEIYPVPSINQTDFKDGMIPVCLIAVPGEEVHYVRSVAERAGLQPVALDLPAFAILRRTEVPPLAGGGLTCLIHVDHGFVSLSIFVGPSLYFFRAVERTDGDLEATLVHDLAFEIERVVNFFNFNLSDVERTVDRVLIHSTSRLSESLVPDIIDRMGRHIVNLDVQSSTADDARYCVAAGLAMKGRV